MALSGAIFTSSNIKDQLYNQNRDYNNRLTWQTALSNNKLAAGKAQSQLIDQYNTASADAYVSYLKNKNAIENSAIVGAGKDELLQSNELALQEAYDSYRSQLAEGSAQVADAAAESETAIAKALEQQAQYTADYANAHWDYLEQLYYDYTQGNNQIFDSRLWNKYVVQEPVLDADGNPVYDDQGNPVTEGRIMTREELANQLYDDQGNLTMEGVDFYDQIENAVAQGGTGMSWGDYLAAENEDLYNWATNYNQYNYTFEGTNAGTFRTMVGMASDDNIWSFAERYGGMNEEELTEMYKPFQEHLEELNSIDASLDADKVVEGIKNVNTDLWDLAEELGLDAQMEELGISRQQTEQWLTDVRSGVKSAGEISGEMLAQIGSMTVAGAGAGTALGGFFAGVGAPIGALVGGFLGFVGGGIMAADYRKRTEEQNRQVTDQLKREYANMLNNVINSQLQDRRQKELEAQNKMVY